MKIRTMLSTLAGTALVVGTFAQTSPNDGSAVSAARSVPWGDVPEPVQRTLKSYAGTASLSGVRQVTINGQAVYIGGFQRNGNVLQVPVTADGSIFTDQNSLAWNQVPTAVQNAFLAQNNVAAIQAITQQVTGGRTVYAFAVRDGAILSEVQFGADGTYLGSTVPGQMPASAEEVAWNQLPAAVQRSATTQAGTARVASVSRAVMSGQPVYEVTAIEPGGERTQFRVSESGVVVGRTIINEAAGAARPLRESGLPLTQLPDRVQTTVKNVAGADQVDSVKPQFVDGTLCYEVNFRRNGRPMSVCVSEEGAVVK